ncbi:Alpha-(1,3)-fucosyltransferase C [Strongyloides ratti]|uniref:Fucosyltransferase n=1 Tax=Strongyloides ratti TaxID=34506 RepID=A0A090LVG4_STRRB|nr:Alpha-(1,3)-fucosyltransferase C [Strongyloides ratti]CEF71649.1 Alpha-(1,3)-fucosyltransferase C [Strongyloides ratti]
MISIAVIYIVYYLYWIDISKKYDKFIHKSISNDNKKQILFWTTFFGSNDLSNLQCKSLNCIITNDKSLFSTSDAVIFHFSDINHTNLPNRAFKLQKFIYFTMESPFSTNNYIAPRNYFNWLMSYNRKSDILFQYGSKWINVDENNNQRLDNNYKNILLNKKFKKIIGFISNCATNSGREYVIKKLSKYINIDIFGKCSNDIKKKNSCPSKNIECEKNLINSYYFYIALENALCNDYVTEKYWSRYMHNSVPIVMRRDIYINIGIPNSSLIAISDYKTSKEMVEHLNYLMNNPKEYLKYFEYRNKNITVMNWDQFNLVNGICALCNKLNDYASILSQERIDDVLKFYTSINNCTTPKNAITFLNDW